MELLSFFYKPALSSYKPALSSYNETASNKLHVAALHGYRSLCCVVACVFVWGEGGGKAASLPFDSSAGNSVRVGGEGRGRQPQSV